MNIIIYSLANHEEREEVFIQSMVHTLVFPTPSHTHTHTDVSCMMPWHVLICIWKSYINELNK